MKEDLIICGSGGFGREVAWAAEQVARGDEGFRICCFVDDNAEKHGKEINGYKVLGLDAAKEEFPGGKVLVAIGSPSSREKMVERCVEIGLESTNLVHPSALISKWVEHGVGTVICAGNIITTNIEIGNQVHVNLDCTIGHDVIMGDYTTLAPGVHVSGWVHFGKRVYVGTGAVFVNGTEERPLIIGDDAVVGAGACVTKSVPEGETWVGIPAKRLGR